MYEKVKKMRGTRRREEGERRRKARGQGRIGNELLFIFNKRAG